MALSRAIRRSRSLNLFSRVTHCELDTTADATGTPHRAGQAWVLWDGG